MKKNGKLNRTTFTINAGTNIKPGDKFTMEGFGKSAKGHNVAGGKSVKTGKPMKAKTLTVYVVTDFGLTGTVLDIWGQKP